MVFLLRFECNSDNRFSVFLDLVTFRPSDCYHINFLFFLGLILNGQYGCFIFRLYVKQIYL